MFTLELALDGNVQLAEMLKEKIDQYSYGHASHQSPPRLSPGPIWTVLAVQLPVYKAEIFQERRPIPSTVRTDDLLRHLQDLRSGTYEGAMSRGAKEVVYRQGINLLGPVAMEILEGANTLFLNGTGNVQMIGPEEDGSGSLVTRFELSWPEQLAARVMRGPNEPLQPVSIVVNYSQGFLHPHLSGSTAGFWPFQVRSAADAGRQKGVLAAIVELELHQRIFETDWRILPISWQSE